MAIRPRNVFLEYFDLILNIVCNHLNHVCEYVWHINKHFFFLSHIYRECILVWLMFNTTRWQLPEQHFRLTLEDDVVMMQYSRTEGFFHDHFILVP